MNTETGEIVNLPSNGLHHHHANGRPIVAKFIPINERESAHLRGREAKERTAELVRLRKLAVKEAKALFGRKLTPEEMKAAVDSVEV